MSENPKAALEAMLENGASADGLKSHPLTLARYALLELVGSPILNPTVGVKFKAIDLVPTLYIMAAEASELKQFGADAQRLVGSAIEWADSLPPEASNFIIDDVMRQLGLIAEVSPEQSGGKDGKQTTKKLKRMASQPDVHCNG